MCGVLNALGPPCLTAIVKWPAGMDIVYCSRTMVSLAGLAFLAGCSAPHAGVNPPGGTPTIVKAELLPWRFFLTVTPEQIQAARSAPECRPAEDDFDGHWGAPWEGIQL